MNLRSVLLVLAAGLVLCASVQAAPVFQVYAEYEASYPADNIWSWDNPYSYSLLTDPAASLTTDLHHFRLMMQTTGAATTPDESLRGLLLNVNLGPGLTPATYVDSGDTFGMYMGNMTQIDPPPAGGSKPMGPVWSDNSDGGDDPKDLQRIVIISVADAAYPNALDPGEASPYMLGEFYLNYDRAGAPLLPAGSDITVGVNVPDLSVTYWSGTTNVLGTDANFAAGAALTVPGREGGGGVAPVVVDALYDLRPSSPDYTGPEPMDFEHTFTTSAGDQPIAWSGLDLISAPGGLLDNDALLHPAQLSGSGLFTWDRRGAALGAYQWQVTATNAIGSDTGFLTIHVPEPSSIALFGLAMIGLVGLVRRR